MARRTRKTENNSSIRRSVTHRPQRTAATFKWHGAHSGGGLSFAIHGGGGTTFTGPAVRETSNTGSAVGAAPRIKGTPAPADVWEMTPHVVSNVPIDDKPVVDPEQTTGIPKPPIDRTETKEDPNEVPKDENEHYKREDGKYSYTVKSINPMTSMLTITNKSTGKYETFTDTEVVDMANKSFGLWKSWLSEAMWSIEPLAKLRRDNPKLFSNFGGYCAMLAWDVVTDQYHPNIVQKVNDVVHWLIEYAGFNIYLPTSVRPLLTAVYGYSGISGWSADRPMTAAAKDAAADFLLSLVSR